MVVINACLSCTQRMLAAWDAAKCAGRQPADGSLLVLHRLQSAWHKVRFSANWSVWLGWNVFCFVLAPQL